MSPFWGGTGIERSRLSVDYENASLDLFGTTDTHAFSTSAPSVASPLHPHGSVTCPLRLIFNRHIVKDDNSTSTLDVARLISFSQWSRLSRIGVDRDANHQPVSVGPARTQTSSSFRFGLRSLLFFLIIVHALYLINILIALLPILYATSSPSTLNSAASRLFLIRHHRPSLSANVRATYRRSAPAIPVLIITASLYNGRSIVLTEPKHRCERYTYPAISC